MGYRGEAARRINGITEQRNIAKDKAANKVKRLRVKGSWLMVKDLRVNGLRAGAGEMFYGAGGLMEDEASFGLFVEKDI